MMINDSSDRTPGTSIREVRFEHHREGLGIGEASPRISWIVSTAASDWQQESYEIEAYAADGRLQAQTGRIHSFQSVSVPWPFQPLASREQLSVRVRAWGKDGQPSAWSEPARSRRACCRPAIGRSVCDPGLGRGYPAPNPAPCCGANLTSRRGDKSSPVHHCAGCVRSVSERRGRGRSRPGARVDRYTHRLRYQTFDVTGLLSGGRNAIGAMLGDGWFRGRIGFGGGRRNIYGDRLALLAQLEMIYADGTSERIVTDESWRAATRAHPGQ